MAVQEMVPVSRNITALSQRCGKNTHAHRHAGGAARARRDMVRMVAHCGWDLWKRTKILLVLLHVSSKLHLTADSSDLRYSSLNETGVCFFLSGSAGLLQRPHRVITTFYLSALPSFVSGFPLQVHLMAQGSCQRSCWEEGCGEEHKGCLPNVSAPFKVIPQKPPQWLLCIFDGPPHLQRRLRHGVL